MDAVTQIAARIEHELATVHTEFERPPFSAIRTPYREALVAYLARGGKRLRPILFMIGYAGYAVAPAPKVYTAELLSLPEDAGRGARAPAGATAWVAGKGGDRAWV